MCFVVQIHISEGPETVDGGRKCVLTNLTVCHWGELQSPYSILQILLAGLKQTKADHHCYTVFSDCAIAQVVWHWLLTSEARVESWVSSCEIQCEHSGTGTGISLSVFSFPLQVIIQLLLHTDLRVSWSPEMFRSPNMVLGQVKSKEFV
jgi:hypothetical protein